MVCIRKDLDNGNYVFPKPLKNNKCVKDILLNSNEVEKYIISKPFQLKEGEEKKVRYEIFNKPLRVGTVNKGGQGDRIYDPMGQAITLSAEGGGTGARTGNKALTLDITNIVGKRSHGETSCELFLLSPLDGIGNARTYRYVERGKNIRSDLVGIGHIIGHNLSGETVFHTITPKGMYLVTNVRLVHDVVAGWTKSMHLVVLVGLETEVGRQVVRPSDFLLVVEIGTKGKCSLTAIILHTSRRPVIRSVILSELQGHTARKLPEIGTMRHKDKFLVKRGA